MGSKKTLSNFKKYLIPAALLLVGIALILLGRYFDGSSSGTFAYLSGESQEALLEDKLKALCERVEGVSEVTVAVSLTDPSAEAGAGNIAGIGIVCRGGDDPTVREKLISLIGAACGVRSNRIYVTEAGN